MEDLIFINSTFPNSQLSMKFAFTWQRHNSSCGSGQASSNAVVQKWQTSERVAVLEEEGEALRCGRNEAKFDKMFEINWSCGKAFEQF